MVKFQAAKDVSNTEKKAAGMRGPCKETGKLSFVDITAAFYNENR